MRRLLSILLLLCLGVGPAFASIPAHTLASGWTGQVDEANIPACCRRNGKPHCSMGTTAPDGTRVFTTSEDCPCLPHSVPATMSGNGVSIAKQVVWLLPAGEGRRVAANESHEPRSHKARAESQRGPPAFLQN